MDRVISATEARIRFGELMREAQRAPIIVERDGEPLVVVLSKQMYDRLTSAGGENSWRELVKEVRRKVKEDLAGRDLPSVGNVIRQLREERDEQITGMY